MRCYFNALLLLPFLTLQSFGVHPALDHSAQAGSSPLVSFDRHGLLDKASALSQRLAAQSSMLVATNPWHRLVNEQLAYALNSYTSGELSATGAKAESSGLEIRRRLKMLDDLDELLTFIQANDELPGSTQFSVETLGVGSSAAFSQSYLLPNNYRYQRLAWLAFSLKPTR